MKDVISVDSNSMSEDTPLDPEIQKLISENLFDLIEPPQDSPLGQDTSLDEYLVDLVDEHFPKGKSKERGQANVMLAYFVMWHKAEIAKLLQVIEDEVIGRDILMDNGTPVNHTLHNFRDRQRQALKKIKERL